MFILRSCKSTQLLYIKYITLTYSLYKEVKLLLNIVKIHYLVHINLHFTLILLVRPNPKFHNFNAIKSGF